MSLSCAAAELHRSATATASAKVGRTGGAMSAAATRTAGRESCWGGGGGLRFITPAPAATSTPSRCGHTPPSRLELRSRLPPAPRPEPRVEPRVERLKGKLV